MKALILRMYGVGLRLYPEPFRVRYGAQMMEAARLWLAESGSGASDLRVGVGLAWDTLRGSLREHARDVEPVAPGFVLMFVIFFTVVELAVSMGHQQVVRRDANRRPAEIVARFAERGASPQVLKGAPMEIASSGWLGGSRTFMVIYDAQGRPVAGNATLHGALPQPPSGVFGFLRSHGEDRVTWAPEPGIRVALVGRALGDGGGFVIAGQSLERPDARTARFNEVMRWVWIFMLAASALIGLRARSARA